MGRCEFCTKFWIPIQFKKCLQRINYIEWCKDEGEKEDGLIREKEEGKESTEREVWENHEEGQVRFLLRECVCVGVCAHARICPSCSVVADPLWPHGLVCQVPLSMKFSRQEYWSGLPFPSPRDLADPGIEPVSLASPLLAGRFFTMWGTREAQGNINQQLLPNDNILS